MASTVPSDRATKIAVSRRMAVPSIVLGVIGGLLAGFVNTQFLSPFTHVTVEAIVVQSFGALIAGILCPRMFWASGLAAGVCLPVFHLVVQLFGIAVPRPVGMQPGDFLTVVPALLSSAAGAGWRIFLSHPITTPKPPDRLED